VQFKRNLQQPGLITKGILALIGTVFILDIVSGGGAIGLGGGNSLAGRFAVSAPSVANGDWYRLLTAGFLHYGVIHLLFNGWAIWNLGTALESSLGSWRFAGLFLASVIAGSAGALLFSPTGLTAGASGGAFGLMAAGFMGSRARGISFSASGWGPTLLMNMFITLAIPGISIGGHLGGALAGAAAGSLLMGRRSMVTPKNQRDQQDAGILIGIIVVSIVIAFFAVQRWKAGV
jgi:membrane associated rhomboid family serine protease